MFNKMSFALVLLLCLVKGVMAGEAPLNSALSQAVDHGVIGGMSLQVAEPGTGRASPDRYSDLPLPARVPGNIEIRLQQGVFDPLVSPLVLPPDLAFASDGPEAGDYYIVQFHGPILTAWRAELEHSGAEIMDYVPDFAYIVRVDAAALKQIRAMKAVRWVGVFHPGFRLSNNLLQSVRLSRTDVWTELVIRGFAGEPADRMIAALGANDARITHQYEDRGGGVIFALLAPEASIRGLAHVPGIAWIEPYFEPALANEIARSDTIMDQNRVESELGLFGQGQIVGVGDSGLSTGDPATVHQDFAGRVIGGTWGSGNCGTWADDNSHGTHVAGSVLGSGVQSGADIPGQVYAGSNAGIAPEAGLYVWSFCNNFSGLPAAPYADYYGAKYAVAPDLRISTNSWGYTGGFGQYNIFTRETDRFVRDFPDMIITYAAGNAGIDANSDGVVDLGSMNMPGTAKNVVTVGASENVRTANSFTWGQGWPTDYPVDPINSDPVADNADGMAAFSGRGPTLSGRLKPDVVAPGTNIVSARNESTGTGWGVYDDFYLYMGGTSMATPLVAGSSAILREYFQRTHEINPGAALVKAMLINGAVDMTPGQYGTGATQEVQRRPDNSQGWGRVHMPNMLIHDGGRALLFEEHTGLGTGQTHQVDFMIVDDSVPLRVTLVWVDAPGTEASHGALVNDLDLEVTDHNDVVHTGNSIINGGSPDRVNNIEGVDLPGAVGGYTVTVSGFNIPDGPQPFALVITGGVGEGESFALGAVEEQVSVCVGTEAGFDLTLLSQAGFDDPVNLGVSGLPGGASAQFFPNPVVPTDPAAGATLTISDTGGVSGGSYALTVTGESNGPSFDPQSEELGLQLGIVEALTGEVGLSSPADGATGIGLQPEFVWSSASGAEGYEIQIATDSGFSNLVIQANTGDTRFQAVSGLAPDATYFWRVRPSNVCGDGTYSDAFSLTTGSVICSSPGVVIPDNNPAGINDDIVLAASGSLEEMQVYIRAPHTWVGDLRFVLAHMESGTSVVLVDRPGVGVGESFGCGNNDYDVWLDDSASENVQDACAGASPAIGGRLQPFEALAAFEGVDRAGTWRLNVSDNAGSDTGRLDEWCLATKVAAPEATQLAFGVQPTTAEVNANVLPEVTVQIQDESGEVVFLDNSTQVQLTLIGGATGANLYSAGPVTVIDGIATFPSLSVDLAGTGYRLEAVDTESALSGATSDAFDITVANSTTAIDSITPAAGQSVGESYTVAVTVTGESPTGTVAVDDGGGGSCQITLPDNSCQMISTTVGSKTITAVYGGDDNNEGSSAETAYSIVSDGPVALVLSLSPTRGVAGAAIMPGLSVQVIDSQGNLVDDDDSTEVTVSFEVNPTGATLSGTSKLTVAGGEAHFTGLSIDLVGEGYRLRVSDSEEELDDFVTEPFDVLEAGIFHDLFEKDTE